MGEGLRSLSLEIKEIGYMQEKGIDGEKYNIKVAERCFQILDLAVAKNNAITIQDVTQALDVNTNMAFRLLNSIAKAGYLDKDPISGSFVLSMKCLRLSTTALQSNSLRKLTMPYLELIWHSFPKANINMGIKNGDDILVIDRIDGNSLPRTYFTPGKKIPFHCSGLGKVLTCSLSDEEIRAMAERCGLKQYTPKTITSVDKLIEELHAVRAERVGRDRNEFIVDDNCSAVPIFNANGEIVAGISVSALVNTMSEKEIEACIPKLKETADRISGVLGYQAV